MGQVPSLFGSGSGGGLGNGWMVGTGKAVKPEEREC